MKRCPFCAEEIQDAAIVCRYCGRDLPPAPSAASVENPAPIPESEIKQEPLPAPEDLSAASETPSLMVGMGVIGGMLVVLMLVVLIGSNNGSARRVPPPPPQTAAEAYASFEKLRAAGKVEDALKVGKKLVSVHAGTSEARKAAGQLEELDKVAQQAKEEKRQREREAKEAEAIRNLAEKWHYSTVSDSMSSRTGVYASIQSDNTVSFDFPYQGAQHANLAMREHPRYGKDLIFSITKGQLLCNSYSGCSVLVRFDDGQAERWGGNETADHDTTTIFVSNYSRFLQKLKKAETVRIQVGVYQQGSPTFEFSVGGFDEKRYRAGG